MTLTPTRRSDYPALVAAFYVALPVQYLLIAMDWYGLFSIFIPVYLFLLLPILASFGGDTTRFLERASKVQWGLMICVYCLSHVPALLTLAPTALAQKSKVDAPAKKLYCWNENGQRVCSDALPADAVNVARDEISAASGELFVLAMNEAKTDGWLYLGARSAD